MATETTADTHQHSEKHLREAEELTIFGEGPQIELQLGHVCNNRCVFCVSGQLTEERLAKQIPADPVLEALRRGRAQGSKRVTFLGGEPTTQQSFMPALELAVELGYETIVIFTNGVKTRKPEFCDKILSLGGNYEWRFSVQGATRDAHDAVTKRRGSFDRIVEGMRYLGAKGQDLTINLCVNEESYRSLPDFPALVTELGVRQIHLDQVRPADAGTRSMDYFREIMPRYSEMSPYFDRMLQGFDAIDPEFDVNLGNYAYCQLPQWAHKIHHDGQKTFTYPADGDGLMAAFDKYPQKRHDKFHPPQCGKCVFVDQCNGVFETYAELYGTDEFQPITVEKLRTLDRGQRFFVQLVEPLLAPFLTARPPEPWKAIELFRNTRDRILEARYADASGRRATLALTPPEGAGPAVQVHPPLIHTSHFRVSLTVDPGVDARDVVALVRWAEDRFAEGPGVTIREPVDLVRLIAGFFSPARLQKGQRRIERLAAAVAQQRRFGDWTHSQTRPLTDGLGAVLTVRGPDAAEVDLVLELQPEEDRPLVGVSYRLGAGATAERARPVVAELMQALRG
jgi:MoaA/NifB/PqqE/SkfB family radical SAM enzyme